jgi:pimeloyl-ACP methyl ester carboxylesterase
MAFAELRGFRMFFTDEGTAGQAMVFVHGFSCDSHDWSWQLAFFGLSHRVVALDLRGHGRSSSPEDGYELRSLAADVAALVDHLGCGPVVAAGHSLGGAIVASLAVERPDLVRAVVALDPGHLVPDEARAGLSAANDAYQAGDPVAAAQGAFAQLSHTAGTPPALAMWHIRRVAGMGDDVLRQTIGGLIGGPEPFILLSNSGPYLHRLDRPILSFYVDPARAAAAATVFPGPPSKTVCFEGSGHWLHQERPDEVNSIIAGWLASLPE